MTIKRIEIENVKGIERAELNLAGRAVTVIKGKNGSGKSSILDAISSIFEGGSDPSLVRKGAKAARVRIELSDGKVIEKQQTAKGATLKVTDENGEVVPKAQTFVDSLAASFAFDPLSFIRADKKSRAAFAAKFAGMSFTGKEIRSLKFGQLDIAEPLRGLVGPDANLGLDEFETLRKSVYDRRKAANGAVSELDKTVTNLRRGLPAEVVEGVGFEDALILHQRDLAALEAAEKSDMDFVEAQVKTATDAARETYERACSAARDARDAELADIRRGEVDAIEGIRAERAPKREDLQKAIGAAQANLSRAGETKALKEHLEAQKARLAEKFTEAEALDKALDALDGLKKSKLDSFPVSGLEFRDGECWRDGIEFDHLNQERQLVTAIEIAFLGMGALPFFVMDEAEHFDGVNFEQVCKDLGGAGCQVIMARVEDGPLRAEPQGSLLTS